jgi:hypothetical protein
MKYYKKENVYIRLNEEKLEMLEVFSTLDQCRVFISNNEQVYSLFKRRTVEHMFTEITKEEFDIYYNNIKEKIQNYE